MEAAYPARSLPHFDYLSVHEGEPSHRPERIPSPRYMERGREVSRLYRSDRPHTEQLGRCEGHGTHRPPHTRGNCQVRGHPMLRRLPPMTAPPKLQNAREYCEFHEQNGHTTKPAQPQPRDEECSTEVVATIARGYAEGIARSAWKAQLKNAQQVLTAELGPLNPTGMIRLPMCFGDKIKSKNLEVDFIVVDVPTAYNVILGRPTLHKYNPKAKKKRIMRRRGRVLYIGLSTTLMLLLLRSLDLSIQGVGGLVPCVLTLGRRRDELHLLRITTLIGGPLMLIHVVEVGLEIAILLKRVGQCHQDFA
ncbi:hypothetical protein Cgig2_008311 [Carnegiea gigantea]|uniref:Uncharacterized protein n=1 Tax=Carnegiea gigantea TaxID=171969 RepID=A0A9Q1JT08_9CARY|nr:hypothetical protein Cgig2_008311 [Carnegiea gigantea]